MVRPGGQVPGNNFCKGSTIRLNALGEFFCPLLPCFRHILRRGAIPGFAMRLIYLFQHQGYAMALLPKRGGYFNEPMGEINRAEVPAPDWICYAPGADPAFRGARPPVAAPTYWNPLTWTCQTEEELWAWSGAWDM